MLISQALLQMALYVIATSIWGSSLISLAAANPWLLDVVRLLCSAYIFYLATRLWKSTNFGKTLNKPIGFRDLFIATTLNPKALLFASAIFPPLAFVSLEFFCLSMLVFIAMTLSIGSGWLAMGGILRSNRSWGIHTPKESPINLLRRRWLVTYSEGEPRFEFVRQRPTDAEILQRKSCRITPDAD